MAILYSNRVPENESEADVIRFLTHALPGDYVLVTNIMLAGTGRVPEIDLVIIKENAIITAEVKGWYGPISGSPYADKITVGKLKPQRNPILQADKQAKSLASYLREPAVSAQIFGDSRIGASLFVLPVVVFSHPDAEILLEAPAGIPLLRLEDVPACVTDPAFKGHHCQIKPEEREKLARFLLNEPVDKQPVKLSPIELPASNGDGVDPQEQKTRLPLPARPPLRERPLLRERPSLPSAHAQERDAERPQIIHRLVPDEPLPPQPQVAPTVTQARQGKGRSLLSSMFGWIMDLPTRAEAQAERVEEQLAGQRRGAITHGQIARAVEKQMEHTLNYLLKETIANNYYVVGLATNDYEQYRPLRERLAEELVDYLQEITRSRDYKLLGTMAVELVEMTALRSGDCHVRSFIQKEVNTSARSPYLELVGSNRRYPLDKPLNRLGRAQENEICLGEIDQQRVVSRLHAQIRQQEGGYLLYDLGSSAGTYLNGARLNGEGKLLRDGDRFILGPTQRVDGKRPLDGSLLFVFRQS